MVWHACPDGTLLLQGSERHFRQAHRIAPRVCAEHIQLITSALRSSCG